MAKAARTQYFSSKNGRWMDYGTLMTVEAARKIVACDTRRQRELNGPDAERYRVDVIEVSDETFQRLTA